MIELSKSPEMTAYARTEDILTRILSISQAMREIILTDVTTRLNMSETGRDGLAYIFEAIADMGRNGLASLEQIEEADHE